MERRNFEIKPGHENPDFFYLHMIDEEGNRLGEASGEVTPSEGQARLRLILVPFRLRNQGIGSALFREFANRAREKGADLLVGSINPLLGSNYENLCEFYSKNGADVDRENGIFVMDLTADPSEE